jgi:hypothetical protein
MRLMMMMMRRRRRRMMMAMILMAMTEQRSFYESVSQPYIDPFFIDYFSQTTTATQFTSNKTLV